VTGAYGKATTRSRAAVSSALRTTRQARPRGARRGNRRSVPLVCARAVVRRHRELEGTSCCTDMHTHSCTRNAVRTRARMRSRSNLHARTREYAHPRVCKDAHICTNERTNERTNETRGRNHTADRHTPISTHARAHCSARREGNTVSPPARMYPLDYSTDGRAVSG
jgi:hypothetical protein